ncbi:MAG: ABC transporter ATP-binding protein [Anaerolineae bacterium]|nr:ABC transporter ATP-binding protein [Anaerolineae bacterium]
MTNVLEANGLRKEYHLGETVVEALRGIDIQVETGEFVAVMGPSGSGKSTLLHLLGGLDEPTTGEINLLEMNLGDMEDEALTLTRRREIGFIFQKFNLLPTLTAAENVALPLMLDDKKTSQHAEEIDKLLEMVGLLERKGHKPPQLSGGEQQRVAIARAFVNQPRIVLADEPTGNLDSKTGGTVLDMLHKVCKELNTTVVMVTHDAKAAAYADRVVFLNDGEIVHEIRQHNGHIEVEDVIAALAELDD